MSSSSSVAVTSGARERERKREKAYGSSQGAREGGREKGRQQDATRAQRCSRRTQALLARRRTLVVGGEGRQALLWRLSRGSASPDESREWFVDHAELTRERSGEVAGARAWHWRGGA